MKIQVNGNEYNTFIWRDKKSFFLILKEIRLLGNGKSKAYYRRLVQIEPRAGQLTVMVNLKKFTIAASMQRRRPLLWVGKFNTESDE